VQPNVLQQATVQIIPNKDCNAQYKGVIIRQQLCASAPGKDSCQVKLPFISSIIHVIYVVLSTFKGDSGGPLVVQAKAGSTAWTQVGVISYGRGRQSTVDCSLYFPIIHMLHLIMCFSFILYEGCAVPDFAGVYASVAFFRNWIDTYMKD
jgi:secreted trypsin-like serine protease